VERRYPIHVERDGGEIARFALEERHDAVDGALHVGRRRRFAGGRESPKQALARLEVVRLWSCTARPRARPMRAASADRRVEEEKTDRRHADRCRHSRIWAAWLAVVSRTGAVERITSAPPCAQCGSAPRGSGEEAFDGCVELREDIGGLHARLPVDEPRVPRVEVIIGPRG